MVTRLYSGLPVKEESEDEPNRTIEPTTFVNVSLACDEAGPSGLQQQKIGEMPEMVMPPTDGDPKSGWVFDLFFPRKQQTKHSRVKDERCGEHTQIRENFYALGSPASRFSLKWRKKNRQNSKFPVKNHRFQKKLTKKKFPIFSKVPLLGVS